MDDFLNKITYNDLNEDQQDLVAVIGLESYKNFVSAYGGTQLYIPKVENVIRSLRDKKIKEEFTNGNSIKRLAIKYNVSTVWIRTIIKEN